MEKNVNIQVAEATKAKGNETQVLNPVSSESSVDKTTSRQKKKTKSKSNLEKTLEKYRNLFRRQVTRNTETRQAVLNCAINELGVSYGRKEFLKELYPRIFRLLDSKKFEKDCQEEGVVPYNAAVYIALQSIQNVYNVLEQGIKSQFGREFSEMKTPVIEMDEFQPYDMWAVLPAQSCSVS